MRTAGFVLAILAIRRSFRQLWARLGLFALANLMVTALSLPILLVLAIAAYLVNALHLVPFAGVILLGILPNPLAAGLQLMTRELVRDDILNLRAQWEGLRQHFRFATILWLPSALLTALITFEVFFYFAASGAGGGSIHFLDLFLGSLWTCVFLFWLALHLYVFPLIIEDPQRRVLSTYRDAAVIVISRPLYTSVVALVWLALFFISAVTGLAVILGLALGALIQQHAFANLFPAFEPYSEDA